MENRGKHSIYGLDPFRLDVENLMLFHKIMCSASLHELVAAAIYKQ
jgi:hypothetical protein